MSTTMSITVKAQRYVAEYLGVQPDDLEVRAVNGGFSRNRKSVVGVDGRWLFAKEVDVTLLDGDGAEELGWLKKEFDLTQYLRSRGFSIVPDWGVLSEDRTVLLLPAYWEEEGWVWDFPEDVRERQRYIEAVIREVHALEGATFSEEVIARYNLRPYFRDKMALNEGFEKLLTDSTARQASIEKIKAIQSDRHTEKIRAFLDVLDDMSALAQLSMTAKRLMDQPNNVFGHCDVRSDNIAFNMQTGEVKLVDWNWASLTPSNFGATEFLVDATRRGIDVAPWREYLNRELLASLVGVWGYKCASPPLHSGSTLREMQALSAVMAYDAYVHLTEAL